MKKSLWIAAVAMTMGFGISSQAIGATFGEWSFSDSVGTAISGPSYASWTTAGTAYVTNGGSGVGNNLYFEGAVSNSFSGLNGKWYKTEFLMKPSILEDLTLLANVDSAARLAFYFDANSNLNLMYGDGANWTTSTFKNTSYPTGTWITISILQDFGAKINGTYPAFMMSVAGATLTTNAAYTRVDANGDSGDFSATHTAASKWFQVKGSSTAGMSSLVALGSGNLDEMTNTETMSLSVLASSTNTAFGTITPNGASTITNPGTNHFVLNAVAQSYVAGLKVDGQTIYTGAEGDSSKDWTLTYPRVFVLGTNVVALFEANPNSSSSWLTNSIDIGPGQVYTNFADAEAGDLDGDGINNKDEAILGTDPTTNTSALKITNITVNAAGQIVVSFPGSADGASGLEYVVEGAPEATGAWSTVTSRTKAGGTFNVTNVDANLKFFRVLVPYVGN